VLMGERDQVLVALHPSIMPPRGALYEIGGGVDNRLFAARVVTSV
jgi:hypothetical protein